MNRVIAATTLSLLTTTAAFAGATTITVLDSSSATKTYNVITDGAGTSGNFVSKMGICDQAAAANCAGVDSNHNLTIGQATAANLNATVIGSVTANAGTNLNTSLLALESGGNLATLAGTVTSARAAVNPISAQAGVQGGAGATTPNTQRIAIASDANAVAATLQASASTAIGKVDPNTIATWGLMSGTVPGGAPSNTQIAGGIYNSASPTPSTGQTLPFQLDASGNLNVNIKAGAGSGGTALQDNTAFAQGTTTATPASCLYATSVTNLTAGDAGVVRCTTDRLMLVAPGSAAASWGNWGIMTGTVPGAAPANTLVAGGIYNSSPPGPTTGQTLPFQLDSAGNLNVNIKAGAGSGGTALADGLTFTEGTTSFTPVGGEYVSGGGANCITGKGCTVQMTIDRMAYVNVGKMGGTAISSSCVSNYGTSPGSVACPSSNVFVTNSTTALPDNVDAVATTSSAANSPTNAYGYLFNGTTFDRVRSGGVTGMAGVSLQASPSGGCTPGSAITATSSVNATNIKGSAGTLCEFTIMNLTTTLVDVRLYDLSSSPTCSSATGVVANYPVQGGTASATTGVTVAVGAYGKAFANGIGFCATGANANNDNTNATVAVNINYSYK